MLFSHFNRLPSCILHKTIAAQYCTIYYEALWQLVMRYEFLQKVSRSVLYSKLVSSRTISDALQNLGRADVPKESIHYIDRVFSRKPVLYVFNFLSEYRRHLGKIFSMVWHLQSTREIQILQERNTAASKLYPPSTTWGGGGFTTYVLHMYQLTTPPPHPPPPHTRKYICWKA